jgi:hypothetical protein
LNSWYVSSPTTKKSVGMPPGNCDAMQSRFSCAVRSSSLVWM